MLGLSTRACKQGQHARACIYRRCCTRAAAGQAHFDRYEVVLCPSLTSWAWKLEVVCYQVLALGEHRAPDWPLDFWRFMCTPARALCGNLSGSARLCAHLHVLFAAISVGLLAYVHTCTWSSRQSQWVCALYVHTCTCSSRQSQWVCSPGQPDHGPSLRGPGQKAGCGRRSQ